jgi:hypothetical protein
MSISWIGSFQLFMQYVPGVVVGRAFDTGYLYVMPPWHLRTLIDLIPVIIWLWLDPCSKWCLCSCCLSHLAVNITRFSGHFSSCIDAKRLSGLPSTRCWYGIWAVIALLAVDQYHWPPFRAKKGIRYRCCCLGQISLKMHLVSSLC